MSFNKLLKSYQKSLASKTKYVAELLKKIASMVLMIESLSERNKKLEEEIALLKNKKTSNNSHIPPSKDENRPMKNQSLREKTAKKVGGQIGHKGTTLLCSKIIDEVVSHEVNTCTNCSSDLSSVRADLVSTRQVLDLPPIIVKCTEHQIFKKQCSCGHITQSVFPAYVSSPVQYGPNVEALIAYLHTRQYLPYARMQELLKDVVGLPISTGGINHVLQRLTEKAMPVYENIKAQIEEAPCVGSDETGVKINGKKHWMWTWQNDKFTYILCSASRGFDTIEEAFENGLPDAILLHDRWTSHFKMDVKGHQVCIAHLLRDFTYLDELYNQKCSWANDFKVLLQDALQLKKVYEEKGYNQQNKKEIKIRNRLKKLLHFELHEDCSKSKTLQKSLLKIKDYILYFLKDKDVPPDNNGSERAIRNIKVKQKISGQFKSAQGADMFAVLRSVIDTSIKNGLNVLNSLALIAKFATE